MSEPSSAKAAPTPSSSSSTLSLKVNAPEFVPVPAAAAKASGSQKQKKVAALNPNVAKAKPFNPPAAKLSGAAVNAAPFVPGAPGSKGQAAAAAAAANLKMSVSAASFVPKVAPAAVAAPAPKAAAAVAAPAPKAAAATAAPAPKVAASTAATPAHRGSDSKNHESYSAHGHNGQSSAAYHRSQNHHNQRKPYPSAPYRSGGGGGRGRGRDGGRMGGRGGSYGLGAPQGVHGYHALGPGRMQLSSRFASDQLRQQLQQRSYLSQAQWVAGEGEEGGVPEKIQNYHSIYPLEDASAGAEASVSVTLGVRSTVYKGVSSQDGAAYCLRHLDGRQVVPSSELVAAARGACEAWGQLGGHPNLVTLRGTFLSDELGGGQSLFFVHDFHPGAVTLAQAHMQATSTAAGLVRNAVTEEQLWSYLVQICQACSAVHGCGLSFRLGALHPSKVLLTGFGRIRVGGLGILDVLQAAGQKEKEREEEVAGLQLRDLVGIGQLVLLLACSMGHAPPSLDYLQAHYSPDLTHLVGALLGAADGPRGGGLSSCAELRGMLGDRAFGELYSQQTYVDTMVTELTKEVENGRLARLLIKLGFINERPGGNLDPSWSETGNRYMVKLFRDFVFHQVSEEGAPLLDWGHVLEALNKVDAGVPEKVLLLGRDEQSLLVASYADLKRCIETSFGELKAAAQAGRQSAAGGLRRMGPSDYSHDHH